MGPSPSCTTFRAETGDTNPGGEGNLTAHAPAERAAGPAIDMDDPAVSAVVVDTVGMDHQCGGVLPSENVVSGYAQVAGPWPLLICVILC